ncbi:MAG: hypothetical protein KIT17_16675, partial [Rubrivivax sp.]|nr:hypothetical protein [Rubrivivax sp.]
MHADTLGWSAAALMVATFATAHARAMRVLAVFTNVAFIAYGLAAGLAPVVALHLVLLPVNAWRGAQAFAAARPQGVAGHRGRLAALFAAVLAAWLLVGCGGGGRGDGDGEGAAPP